LDFSTVHLYPDPISGIDLAQVVKDVSKVLDCKMDVRKPFPILDVERARISDIKQPYERQPKERQDFDLYGRPVKLYDGFELQKILAQNIKEGGVHIIFTDLLACTFSEDDWRYHTRAIVCGTPSIILATGIIEAPAKPREFYMMQYAGHDVESLKRKFAGRFIDYGDDRMAQAAAGYVLQALFFFLTDGEPFCESDSCRLHNAHWQQDLIRTQVENPAICARHMSIARKFNRRLAAKKRI
jgi:hypothetical protein